jgi:cytoskeletal protein CcmA (bactofilin family)
MSVLSLFRKEEPTATGSSNLDTVLGAGANLQGVLKSGGNIRVDGILQGRIETAGNVVIGPSARVVADVSANAVQVWGMVQGNIQADGRLEILSTGRVFGELNVAALMIDKGGLFRGHCYMNGEDVDLIDAPMEERLLTEGDEHQGNGLKIAASDASEEALTGNGKHQ